MFRPGSREDMTESSNIHQSKVKNIYAMSKQNNKYMKCYLSYSDLLWHFVVKFCSYNILWKCVVTFSSGCDGHIRKTFETRHVKKPFIRRLIHLFTCYLFTRIPSLSPDALESIREGSFGSLILWYAGAVRWQILIPWCTRPSGPYPNAQGLGRVG